MRKGRIGILVVVLVLALILALVLCLRGCTVRIDAQSTGRVVYDAHGVKFEDELTADEIAAVMEVLDGEWMEASILGKPSCGFDKNIAIVIDGRRFAMGLDGCGTLWVVDSSSYIHISDAEQDVLAKIFNSRGGKIPGV